VKTRLRSASAPLPLVAALCAALAGLVAAAPAARAQQILIDQPVRAGELILFPDLNDRNTYFYVSDKPHLAIDAAGTPKFSFLRWVDNRAAAADQPLLDEGEGGGIVHALVALAVTPEQLNDARRELQRLRPGARIQGPVVFKAGRFALVSSFVDPQGNLGLHTAGIGNAPLLDGENVATSILLSKQGAKVLWESFATPTPDISFSFEMELAGYRAPHRAVIEADFDQIYAHDAFGVGLASTYLSAEIRGTFDDLRRTGAIKLTQVGDDEDLEALINAAYSKIAEIMFQPVNGTGSPDLSSLTSAAGGQGSLLDRASAQLQRGREETRAENERRRARNREREEARRRDAAAGGTASAGGTAASGSAGGAAAASAAETRAQSLETRATAAEARVTALRERARTATGADATAVQELIREAEQHATTLRELAREARTEATRLREAAGRTSADRDTADAAEEMESAPSFAIVASYEMKRVRQSGKFSIDLNKYTSDTITLRFDQNIGDLRRLRGDAAHFREVNLADPLFIQREIVASVDVSARDFGDYVNWVTVQMRKRHAGGAETLDEVHVDRANFNSAGNAFKLLYGWKGDNDRRRWFDYEVQERWSFFGGAEVVVPWRATNSGKLNLTPPYQKRGVTVEADPDRIAAAGVRLVTVKLFYRPGPDGSPEKVKQVTLNPAKAQLSERIEFILPEDRFDYEYEVTWRRSDDRLVSAPRQRSSEATLFVDNVPAG
jgi:hypothetical protein